MKSIRLLRLSTSATFVLIGGATLFGAGAAPARSETGGSGSPIRFSYLERQASQPVPSADAAPHAAPAPTRVVARQAPARRASALKPIQPVALAPASPPRSRAPVQTVTVYGDRLGQALVRGLGDDAGGWLAVADATSEDTGLARADFATWLEALRTRLATPTRSAVAVMLLGSNDRQPIADGDATAEVGSARWQTLYAARIDAVAAVFRDAHLPLIWVGLPSVHGEDVAASYVSLNALYRDRAGQDGLTFVDSWEAFSDDTGAYNPMGPDVDGHMAKLRKADGMGFTRAGARKLASFVEGDIRRLGGSPPPADVSPATADITIDKARDFDQALEVDVNAQIEREMALALPAATSRTAPVSSTATAGPVLSLTVAPTATDGQLATSSIGTADARQAALVSKSIDTIGATTLKTGRTDDFSWPRP